MSPEDAMQLLRDIECAEDKRLTQINHDLDTLKGALLVLIGLQTGASIPQSTLRAIIEKLGGRVSNIVTS